MYLMPQTEPGRWSFYLTIAFFVLLAIFFVLVESGERGGETYFSNLKLAVPFTAAWICAIGGFFTGVIAIVWRKERAVLVFISSMIGLFVLWFIGAEFIFLH